MSQWVTQWHSFHKGSQWKPESKGGWVEESKETCSCRGESVGGAREGKEEEEEEHLAWIATRDSCGDFLLCFLLLWLLWLLPHVSDGESMCDKRGLVYLNTVLLSVPSNSKPNHTKTLSTDVEQGHSKTLHSVKPYSSYSHSQHYSNSTTVSKTKDLPF